MLSITLVLLLAVLPAGCQNEAQNQSGAASVPEGGAQSQAAPASYTGAIVETMDSGGYTYVKLRAGEQDIWAAAPQCEVEVGQEVTIAAAMPMDNFRSDTLDRTFDRVYFVNGFGEAQSSEAADSPAWAHGKDTASPPADVDLSGIPKVAGGFTVAEIHALGASLEGKQVQVRGKIVKYLPGIMGKNWIHLRDGSGAAGSNDLTVTTNAEAEVGDLVLITGPLSVNKDFGAGYEYDVIVEDASVTVE